MRTISICMLGLVWLGGVAHAAPKATKADCSKPAVRKARAEADKAVRAKEYPKAIALLEPVVRGCETEMSPTEHAWLAGDLAVAYDRNGQYSSANS